MAAEFVALKLAESVVSQAVERLADLLIHEASSLRNVHGDIQSLQTELKWIESFLRDADKKQEKDERVRVWIAEVRDVACEIEDSVDTYVSKVRTSFFSKAVHLRKLRTHVSSINDKLRSIGERRQRYQIEFPDRDLREPDLLKNQRRSYPDEEEDDIITLKSTISALKDQLIKKEDRRCVVSIVGMGGLGKTTLAKKAFNDAEVKKNFGCSAWVFVSQQCVAREVMIEILMQVGFRTKNPNKRAMRFPKDFVEERRNKREILKGLEDHELVALLKSELNEKRYLIVLDDVWSVEAWRAVERAFPKGNPGSKVVFTTRIREVAVSADPYTAPIEPPLLTELESWELLKRKAFPKEIFGSRGFSPSPEFEKLGKEMVAECGGLPLAIVVLGGLLRTKNSVEEWSKVKKDVKSRMINKLKSERQYRVEDILELSFQELPHYLKPCFLYLGSFPEDSEIQKRKLIRLWIAEGFIKTNKAEIEEIGEKYLEELINRCMVQIDKNNHTGRGVKSVRLHDLMRDFCLSTAKEELFLEINAIDGPSSSLQYTRPRRIAVHVDNSLSAHPRLRSLVCFSIRKLPGFYHFRLLRVLQLDFLAEAKSPYGIGDLIHLKYLRISGRGGHNFFLPNSLGNLRNLQTLDLIGIQIYGEFLLPSSVWKLTQLRHLMLPLYYYLPFWAINRFFGSKTTQTKLETLKGIHAKDLLCKKKSLPPMPNLKVLGIQNLRSSKEATLILESLDSQSRLANLRSLTMSLSASQSKVTTYFVFPKMELLSHCESLTKLELYGTLPNESLAFLPKSLAKLRLSRSALNQSKIAVFEKLPNLRVVELCYEELKPYNPCQKWIFSSSGFQKLEVLVLLHVGNLEEWEVKEGGLPSLRKLDITGLSKLKAVPEGLRYVATLREVSFKMMRKDFVDKLRRARRDGTEGEDFYKVRHVPSVTFSDTRP